MAPFLLDLYPAVLVPVYAFNDQPWRELYRLHTGLAMVFSATLSNWWPIDLDQVLATQQAPSHEIAAGKVPNLLQGSPHFLGYIPSPPASTLRRQEPIEGQNVRLGAGNHSIDIGSPPQENPFFDLSRFTHRNLAFYAHGHFCHRVHTLSEGFNRELDKFVGNLDHFVDEWSD